MLSGQAISPWQAAPWQEFWILWQVFQANSQQKPELLQIQESQSSSPSTWTIWNWRGKLFGNVLYFAFWQANYWRTILSSSCCLWLWRSPSTYGRQWIPTTESRCSKSTVWRRKDQIERHCCNFRKGWICIWWFDLRHYWIVFEWWKDWEKPKNSGNKFQIFDYLILEPWKLETWTKLEGAQFHWPG